MSPVHFLPSGCFLLLIVFAHLPRDSQAGINLDCYKYHPPKGYEECARKSVMEFLSKAAEARREELEIVRSHIRRVFDLRMNCIKKELTEFRAARRERRRLRRIARGSGTSFASRGKIHKGGPGVAEAHLQNDPGQFAAEIDNGNSAEPGTA